VIAYAACVAQDCLRCLRCLHCLRCLRCLRWSGLFALLALLALVRIACTACVAYAAQDDCTAHAAQDFRKENEKRIKNADFIKATERLQNDIKSIFEKKENQKFKKTRDAPMLAMTDANVMVLFSI
jgi:hypothetical protein